jgi:hypothetical protein
MHRSKTFDCRSNLYLATTKLWNNSIKCATLLQLEMAPLVPRFHLFEIDDQTWYVPLYNAPPLLSWTNPHPRFFYGALVN